MFNKKKIFLDPVYQTDVNGIRIRESVYTLMSEESWKRWELYEELFGTLEFALSNFRSYLGPNFLVYPSANCSYFSHAIGNWIITHYIINNVVLRDIKSKSVKSLQKELWDANITEELLIVSMLENISVIPFQSIFYENPLLIKRFGKNVDAVLFDIVSGKGTFYKKLKEIANSRNTLTVHDVLLKYEEENSNSINVNTVINLLNGNVQLKNLHLLHILFDRISPSSIDRINRVSFYLGAKSEAALTKDTIDNIILTNSDKDPIVINDDGAISMLRILFDWVSLIGRRASSEYVAGYSYMLNEGLNLLLDNNLIDPIELLGLSDIEFINLMASFKETKDLAYRILYMKPYEPIIKVSYVNIGLDGIKSKVAEFAKKSDLSQEAILFVPQFEAAKNLYVKKWLDIPVIADDGRFVPLNEFNSRLVEYLQKQFSVHSNVFYILYKKHLPSKEVVHKAREFFREEVLPW